MLVEQSTKGSRTLHGRIVITTDDAVYAVPCNLEEVFRRCHGVVREQLSEEKEVHIKCNDRGTALAMQYILRLVSRNDCWWLSSVDSVFASSIASALWILKVSPLQCELMALWCIGMRVEAFAQTPKNNFACMTTCMNTFFDCDRVFVEMFDAWFLNTWETFVQAHDPLEPQTDHYFCFQLDFPLTHAAGRRTSTVRDALVALQSFVHSECPHIGEHWCVVGGYLTNLFCWIAHGDKWDWPMNAIILISNKKHVGFARSFRCPIRDVDVPIKLQPKVESVHKQEDGRITNIYAIDVVLVDQPIEHRRVALGKHGAYISAAAIHAIHTKSIRMPYDVYDAVECGIGHLQIPFTPQSKLMPSLPSGWSEDDLREHNERFTTRVPMLCAVQSYCPGLNSYTVRDVTPKVPVSITRGNAREYLLDTRFEWTAGNLWWLYKHIGKDVSKWIIDFFHRTKDCLMTTADDDNLSILANACSYEEKFTVEFVRTELESTCTLLRTLKLQTTKDNIKAHVNKQDIWPCAGISAAKYNHIKNVKIGMDAGFAARLMPNKKGKWKQYQRLVVPVDNTRIIPEGLCTCSST